MKALKSLMLVLFTSVMLVGCGSENEEVSSST